ncbi:MAG: polymer-forming cytoskeletal protein [Anaerolineales bacterium]|nr:polymer-forming cytoskeletal protein [Chloroflexota bacterium]MBL6981654.1 polymer-forming cytoskeletal protein [Anaerolineales bacterium]
MKKLNSIIRWLVPFALVLVLSFGFVGSAQAFEFIDNADLPAGEVIDDDLFIAGDNIVIDGTVNGDLFAFGQNIEFNGVVNGSLITGGQFIEINGEVAGSVYVGGNAATVGSSASIGRNFYFGGFSLDVADGAQINRDLAFGGYQAFLNGAIGRDIYAGAGALEIGGAVGGDVNADVGDPDESMQTMPFFSFMPAGSPAVVSPGLRISDSAKIGGSVKYTSNKDQSADIETTPGGGIVHSTPVPDADIQYDQPTQVAPTVNVGRWLLQRAREFVTLLALGALVLWLIPDLLNKVINKATSEPLPSTGWGLVTVIGGYVGAAVLGGLVLALAIFFGVITLGGLGRTITGVGFSSIGLAMAVFVLLVTYGSKLVIAFWIGKFSLKKTFPQFAESKVWPLVLGVVIYVLLRAIPVLGWIIGVVVTLIGLGAMWLVFQDWRKPAALEAEAA